MNSLESIKQPVAEDFAKYEAYLRETLSNENPVVGTMLDYILGSRGKGMRPLLAILSASAYNGGEPLPDNSYLAAIMLEMIHTATLVHDDVIDEAFMRRGKASVNALWRSQKAVLIGDYILARTFNAGMEKKAYDIVAYITACMADICEGELIQDNQSDLLEMSRGLYNEIIYKKTATLIGTSCGVGAMSVGAPADEVDKMKEIGDAVGMAFQIKDDILDYRPSSDTGKPLCGDLRERKITLPLLCVLENSSPIQKRHIIGLLSDVRRNRANVGRLFDIVNSEGGLSMAADIMDQYIKKARTLLESCPDSAYRTSLDNLFVYIAGRKI